MFSPRTSLQIYVTTLLKKDVLDIIGFSENTETETDGVFQHQTETDFCF